VSGVAAGGLRHKVALHQPVIQQDPLTGEQIVLWVTVADVWANVEPLSGREYFSSGAEQSDVRTKITIRYRDGLGSDMRILFRGKLYSIFTILPDNESGIEHLTLMCGNGVRHYEVEDPSA